MHALLEKSWGIISSLDRVEFQSFEPIKVFPHARGTTVPLLFPVKSVLHSSSRKQGSCLEFFSLPFALCFCLFSASSPAYNKHLVIISSNMTCHGHIFTSKHTIPSSFSWSLRGHQSFQCKDVLGTNILCHPAESWVPDSSS